VSDFLARFGRNAHRERASTSDFWRIDLRSLGGPITALARVALNLPQKSRKPPNNDAPHSAVRRDEVFVAWCARRPNLNRLAHIDQELAQLRVRDQVGDRVMALWDDALPEKHLKPACLGE